jgi:hypothetical protein
MNFGEFITYLVRSWKYGERGYISICFQSSENIFGKRDSFDLRCEGHGSVCKSKAEDLPESKILKPVLLHSRRPIFLIGLAEMFWHIECIKTTTDLRLKRHTGPSCNARRPSQLSAPIPPYIRYFVHCILHGNQPVNFLDSSLNGWTTVKWNWHPWPSLWDPAILRIALVMSNPGSQWRISKIIYHIGQKRTQWGQGNDGTHDTSCDSSLNASI